MPTLPDTLGGYSTPTPQRRTQSANATAGYNIDLSPIQQGAQAITRSELSKTEAAIGVMDSVRQAALNAEEMRRKDAMLDAQDRENRARREMLGVLYGDDNNEGLYNAQGANALGVSKKYQERFRAIREKSMEGVSDPLAMQALNKSLDNLDLSNLDNIKRFEVGQRQEYVAATVKDKAVISLQQAGLEWNNDQTFQRSLADSESAAISAARVSGRIDPASLELAKRTARSSVYSARLNSMLDSDDLGAVRRAQDIYDQALASGDILLDASLALDQKFDAIRPKLQAHEAFSQLQASQYRPTKVNADEIVSFVMSKAIEGGSKTVKDGNGIAQYGLNSVANPDLPVGKLTEAEAKEAYIKRYWDPIGASSMPENMRLLAFDTAVNHGVDKAKDLLKEANNDPLALIELRRKEYQRLAQKDPEQYGKNLPGWMKRLNTLAAEGLSGDGSVDLSRADAVAGLLPPETQSEFKSLVEAQNKAVTAQKTLAVQGTLDQAFQYMQETGKGWAQMPNTLRAAAVQSGVAKDLSSYDGTTKSETASWLYSLSAKDLKEVDLNTPAIRLSLSPSDYERWTAKKKAIDSPAMMATTELRQQYVRKAFEKRAINPNKKDGKLQNIRLNELLDLDIDAFAAQNNGRLPGPAELQKMIDGLFVKGVVDTTPGTNWNPLNWGGGKDFAFDVAIDDIPKDARSQIEEALRKRGRPVTDSTIISTYLRTHAGQ